MLWNKVLISYDGNFYDEMVGNVIGESDTGVFVEIKFSGLESHKILFFKHQVELYNEN